MTGSVPPAVLELDNASFGYDGGAVVDHLRVTITRGEVVAILGANGSGKSTLVRGILGLAQHQGGAVAAFGTPIGALRDRWRLGYVPQQNTLARGIPVTVREVVASGRLSKTRPWKRSTVVDHGRVRDAIARVGLTGSEQTLVAELSGGQQRRVLVARALAGDAEVLLLDEPNAGVDAENQQALADALATLAADGTTILLVAHELGPAASIVSRVLVLSGGRLVYDGPPRPQDTQGGDDHHHMEEPEPPHRFGLGA